MTSIISQCAMCAHLRDGQPWTCAAFPKGIPDSVKVNEPDHREPIAGDNNVQWLPHATGARHPLEPFVVESDDEDE